MSSFFTFTGPSKKRKRVAEDQIHTKRQIATEPSTKQPKVKLRRKTNRDDSISGSDEEIDSVLQSEALSSEVESGSEASASVEETAATRRLHLAEQYLSNIRNEVVNEDIGFDAADLDKDLIAERLKGDVAEGRGRLYRHLAGDLNFGEASYCHFGWDGLAFTAVALCDAWAYTVSKDLALGKWRIQDMFENQFVQKDVRTRRRKRGVQKVVPLLKRKPIQVAFVRGDKNKAKDLSFQGHTDVILSLAASQDGKFVVTGGRDRKIIVWQAETLKPLKVFSQHRDAVTGLIFRRGTNQLYSSSKDRTLKVWSLDEMAYVETLFGHQDEVLDVAALSQERCISVGARDRSARLWKVAEETQLVFRGGGSGERKSKRDTATPAASILECSMDRVAMVDEEMFVTGGDNGSISLWVIHKKKPIFTMPLCHGTDPLLTLDEASAEKDPSMDIIPAPQPRWITALTTIPYSDVILSGSWDDFIRVWKVSGDKKIIEPVGVLGPLGFHEATPSIANYLNDTGTAVHPPARGVVNDLTVCERGERGKDGLCIVAALGKEHRLGRWKKVRGKNGAVVFEVRKEEKSKSNGITKLKERHTGHAG